MNRSKSPPPVDLEKYLKGKKHRYCTYAQGARLYAMAYWSFVNICKEAKANIKLRKTALVDLDVLDDYIEKNCILDLKREDEDMARRKLVDNIEELVKEGKKKYVRYAEGAELYSMGLEESSKCIFIVDCENSDPYSLCAAIRGLDEEKLSKIDKIILFDDVHAASAWDMLEGYISIPVEYILIERLKESKSLADVKVTARTCREFYENDVDSFVLVSSDSDYWGLLQELPCAKFLIMMEHKKCSHILRENLTNKGVTYCYIVDFSTQGGEDIKTAALQKELADSFKEAMSINIGQLMRNALVRTRIDMSDEEADAFTQKIRDRLKLQISDEGDVVIAYQAM